MNRDELLKALRMMFAPNNLQCLGCGYEHNCSIHGCAIIRAAMEEIMQLAAENTAMRRKLSPEDADACKRPMSPAERDALLEWPPYPAPNPPLALEGMRKLKMYEDILFSADGKELISLEQLREMVSQNPNQPLTLEELGEMEGDPVWISGEGIGCYDVCCGISSDGIVQFYKAALPAVSCGKAWLAYRGKPEEGTT